MNIRLAHHFWQNNANATWNPEVFPYPAIEEKIKQNYSLLEAERPAWKQYGSITVFFDYRPAKDIYNRDITPISFAFLQNCRDPAACSKAIKPELSRASTNQLSMDVELPKACLPGQRFRSLPAIAALCVIAAALALWPLIRGGDGKDESPVSLAPVSRPEARADDRGTQFTQTPATPVQPEGATPDIEAKAAAPASAPASTAAESAPRTPYEVDSELQGLCDRPDIISRWKKCERLYFQDYCNISLEPGDNFDLWKKRNKDKCEDLQRSKVEDIIGLTEKSAGFPSRKSWKGKLEKIFNEGVEK